MTAAWTAASLPGVRLGITVSRRMSRRSIDRSLVKRIVREAFRHAAGPLDQFAVRDGLRLDLSFRVKRAIESTGAGGRPPLTRLRAQLRADAEAAFGTVQRHFAMANPHD